MNTNTPLTPPVTEATPSLVAVPAPAPLSPLENFVRRYPALTALAAAGVGCAIGLSIRELLTPAATPRHRAQRLLEDLQHHFTDLAQPAYQRASHLADDGLSAVKRGMHTAADSSLGHRFKNLFA